MTLQPGQSAAAIVALACQAAKGTKYTVQAGQLLNVILQSLNQDYDLDVARGKFTFNFVADNGSGLTGGGPINLATDYLRCEPEDFFYMVNGVPYVPVNIDLAEYDALAKLPGTASYPYNYATDLSQTPPVLYLYPPSSGAYAATMRYRRQMPDITTPETSSTVPWFPNQGYLIKMLTALVMDLTGDTRAAATALAAEGMLLKYLNLKDDHEARAQTVKLDKRRFGLNWSRLPNTKALGW